MSDHDAKPKADGAESLSTAGLERMFRVAKTDHPDLVGGIVWADCELGWINERITLAILAEREACADVCEAEGDGHRDGFGQHCAAIIRMRSNVKVSCPEAVSLPEGRARP